MGEGDEIMDAWDKKHREAVEAAHQEMMARHDIQGWVEKGKTRGLRLATASEKLWKSPADLFVTEYGAPVFVKAEEG